MIGAWKSNSVGESEMRGFSMESLKLREDDVEMNMVQGICWRHLWMAFVVGTLLARQPPDAQAIDWPGCLGRGCVEVVFGTRT